MALRRWMFVAVEVGAIAVFAETFTAPSLSAVEPVQAAPNVAGAPVKSAEPAAKPVALSAQELREAVAASLRRANTAKGSDFASAVKSLADVYDQLGRDVLLPAKERLRLGLQVRSRLARFASQIRYETAHDKYPSGAAQASSESSSSQSGAAGAPAAQGLNSLVELIQTTIARPDDWVVRQQNGFQQGGAGQMAGFGVGGGAAGGAQGGAFGNGDALDKATAANGADLVDLIQKTIDPPSWDANGGPGTIMYFNNLRVLVVRQTSEAQDDVGGLLGGLRK